MKPLSLLFSLLFFSPLLAETPQLMDATTLQRWKQNFPKIDDPNAELFLKDPNSQWYTEREMPKLYQDWGGGLLGIFPADRNVSAVPGEPTGNANKEMPWNVMGGTDEGSSQVSTVKALRLPPKANTEERWPVVYWRGSQGELFWIYPNETEFCEMGFLHFGDNLILPFETRFRDREPNDWGIRIFKNFPTRDEMVAWLASQGRVDLALKTANPGPNAIENITVRASHPRQSFEATARVQKLPQWPRSLVLKALRLEQREATGIEWAPGLDGFTTEHEGQIVPRNYNGAHLGTDRLSCAECHKHTMRRARDFDGAREWYGMVRGSYDGIFSWYPMLPVEQSLTIGDFGRNRSRQDFRIKLRRDFVSSGMVEGYSKSKHPQHRYMRFRYE